MLFSTEPSSHPLLYSSLRIIDLSLRAPACTLPGIVTFQTLLAPSPPAPLNLLPTPTCSWLACPTLPLHSSFRPIQKDSHRQTTSPLPSSAFSPQSFLSILHLPEQVAHVSWPPLKLLCCLNASSNLATSLANGQILFFPLMLCH